MIHPGSCITLSEEVHDVSTIRNEAADIKDGTGRALYSGLSAMEVRNW